MCTIPPKLLSKHLPGLFYISDREFTNKHYEFLPCFCSLQILGLITQCLVDDNYPCALDILQFLYCNQYSQMSGMSVLGQLMQGSSCINE